LGWTIAISSNCQTTTHSFKRLSVLQAQIDDYLATYVINKAPLWTTTQYMEILDEIPTLQELVNNPFLLTLSLEESHGHFR